MNEPIKLTPVESVEITILVDNFMDILIPATGMVQRAPIRVDTFESEQLIAEHGFSVLVTIRKDGHAHSLLYDAGLGASTLIHNMELLDVRLDDLRAMVLSHGHTDHHGGLPAFLKQLNRKSIPLVLHPDAWRDRKMQFPTGTGVHLPPPSRADLEREGVEVLERRDPSLLIDGLALVTGQVERVTDFEQGAPGHFAQGETDWEADPMIWDDQALVMHVRDRGLVVVSGCSHAGIVNVLHYAQKLTGIEQVYGVMGGFHLSGKFFEKIVGATVNDLVEINPHLIMPCHCTGWKAVHEIARRMPDAFVQPCVGSRLQFKAEAPEAV